MRQLLSCLCFLSFLMSCGSKERKLDEREHDEIKRDYEVRDASSQHRPGWIEDAELWAGRTKLDIDNYRYFSYETTPKVNRSIACKIANAEAKTDIAGEIATFIEKTLAQYDEGDASLDMNDPQVKPMQSYIETTLAEKTLAMIHGATVKKRYWEKRDFQQDLGAKKDFIGYTCAVLVRIDSKMLKRLVERASKNVANQAPAEVKGKVEQALKNLDENFVKARKGMI